MSIAQNVEEVKNVELMPADLGLAECGIEWCRKIVFRRGLCFEHYIKKEAQDAARYVFGDSPPYGCGCVLPEQSCLDCEAAAREVYGGEELPF